MCSDLAIKYQWASDVAFDGIRLEILSDDGDVFFEVSVPDIGKVMINTFGNDVPVLLVTAAIEIAQRRKSD